jgi:hypothetical protein
MMLFAKSIDREPESGAHAQDAAALVVPSASGAAVPVSDPMEPDEIKTLLSEDIINKVTEVRGQLA